MDHPKTRWFRIPVVLNFTFYSILHSYVRTFSCRIDSLISRIYIMYDNAVWLLLVALQISHTHNIFNWHFVNSPRFANPTKNIYIYFWTNVSQAKTTICFYSIYNLIIFSLIWQRGQQFSISLYHTSQKPIEWQKCTQFASINLFIVSRWIISSSTFTSKFIFVYLFG